MRKTLFTLILMGLGCMGTNAQIEIGEIGPCPPEVQIMDSTYPYYLFERPFPTEGVLTNGINQWEDFLAWDSLEYKGVRYIAPQPVWVYGIASIGECYYEGGHFAIATLTREGGAEILTYLASKPSHNYERDPELHMSLPRDNNDSNAYLCIAMHEEYFKHPVLVEDTFYVGFIRDTSISGHGAAYPHCIVPDTFVYHSPFPPNILLYGNRRTYHPQCNRTRFWGGFFPIIHPFEEDSLFCDTVHKFRLEEVRLGYPTFAWDTSRLYDQDLFELQYAPYGSNNWVTEQTTASSLKIYAVFDPTVYYKARIRARQHHLCPGHDTIIYSSWSEPILFYTGTTEPDTTAGINPVEDAGSLFTLTPNPTTGTVRVDWGGHTPSPLRGTPPVSGGEPPRTCPSVDAAASSPSMRVASSGDHEGDEAKSPRSRATSISKSSRDGGVCITLHDAAGHEVLRMTVEKGQKAVELDLAALPKGTYFVTLATPTVSATQRLVLQ